MTPSRRLLRQQCTIIAVALTGAADAYGRRAEVTSSSTSLCEFQQTSRSRTDPGDRVVDLEEGTLYLPAGTVIAAGDRVVIDGATWLVEGPPRVDPRRRVGLVVCTLHRSVTG